MTPTVNPWIIIGVVTLLAITNTTSYFEGRAGGKKDVYAEWESDKAKHVNAKIETKVKQDVIQNAPINTGITSRRLRQGSF